MSGNSAFVIVGASLAGRLANPDLPLAELLPG